MLFCTTVLRHCFVPVLYHCFVPLFCTTVLYHCFVPLFVPLFCTTVLYHCLQMSELQAKTGQVTAVAQPNYIFEVVYEGTAEDKFCARQAGNDLIYAYHGSRTDNFHSILHCGLQGHMNKVVYFSSSSVQLCPYLGSSFHSPCYSVLCFFSPYAFLHHVFFITSPHPIVVFIRLMHKFSRERQPLHCNIIVGKPILFN